MSAREADEKYAYEQEALRQWAEARPKIVEDYDNPSTGELRIAEDRALAEWARQRPQTQPNPYDLDRR